MKNYLGLFTTILAISTLNARPSIDDEKKEIRKAYMEVKLTRLNANLKAYKSSGSIQPFLNDIKDEQFNDSERSFLSNAIVNAKFPTDSIIDPKARSIIFTKNFLGTSQDIKLEKLEEFYEGNLNINGIKVNIGMQRPTQTIDQEFKRIKKELIKAPWSEILSDKKLSLWESIKANPLLFALKVALSPLALFTACDYFKSTESIATERGLQSMGGGWFKDPVTNKTCFDYFGQLRGEGCQGNSNNGGLGKNSHTSDGTY